MVPPAPGLWWSRTDRPPLLVSSCARMRATMSAPPPAAAPTSSRSCLDGNDCARPAPGSRPAAAAERISDRRYMTRFLPCLRPQIRTPINLLVEPRAYWSSGDGEFVASRQKDCGQIGRKQTMKYSALLVAVGALGAGTAFAQEPIKIGAMYPLTGGGAVYGVPAMVGHPLAVEELNAKGGIMGRKIESIERDDKMNPAAASSTMKELITKDKVDIVVGRLSP